MSIVEEHARQCRPARVSDVVAWSPGEEAKVGETIRHAQRLKRLQQSRSLAREWENRSLCLQQAQAAACVARRDMRACIIRRDEAWRRQEHFAMMAEARRLSGGEGHRSADVASGERAHRLQAERAKSDLQRVTAQRRANQSARTQASATSDDRAKHIREVRLAWRAPHCPKARVVARRRPAPLEPVYEGGGVIDTIGISLFENGPERTTAPVKRHKAAAAAAAAASAALDAAERVSRSGGASLAAEAAALAAADRLRLAAARAVKQSAAADRRGRDAMRRRAIATTAFTTNRDIENHTRRANALAKRHAAKRVADALADRKRRALRKKDLKAFESEAKAGERIVHNAATAAYLAAIARDEQQVDAQGQGPVEDTSSDDKAVMPDVDDDTSFSSSPSSRAAANKSKEFDAADKESAVSAGLATAQPSVSSRWPRDEANVSIDVHTFDPACATLRDKAVVNQDEATHDNDSSIKDCQDADSPIGKEVEQLSQPGIMFGRDDHSLTPEEDTEQLVAGTPAYASRIRAARHADERRKGCLRHDDALHPLPKNETSTTNIEQKPDDARQQLPESKVSTIMEWGPDDASQPLEKCDDSTTIAMPPDRSDAATMIEAGELHTEVDKPLRKDASTLIEIGAETGLKILERPHCYESGQQKETEEAASIEQPGGDSMSDRIAGNMLSSTTFEGVPSQEQLLETTGGARSTATAASSSSSLGELLRNLRETGVSVAGPTAEVERIPDYMLQADEVNDDDSVDATLAAAQRILENFASSESSPATGHDSDEDDQGEDLLDDVLRRLDDLAASMQARNLHFDPRGDLLAEQREELRRLRRLDNDENDTESTSTAEIIDAVHVSEAPVPSHTSPASEASSAFASSSSMGTLHEQVGEDTDGDTDAEEIESIFWRIGEDTNEGADDKTETTATTDIADVLDSLLHFTTSSESKSA